jgi:hypothetical protein
MAVARSWRAAISEAEKWGDVGIVTVDAMVEQRGEQGIEIRD